MRMEAPQERWKWTAQPLLEPPLEDSSPSAGSTGRQRLKGPPDLVVTRVTGPKYGHDGEGAARRKVVNARLPTICCVCEGAKKPRVKRRSNCPEKYFSLFFITASREAGDLSLIHISEPTRQA